MTAPSKKGLSIGPRDHVVQFYRHDDELIERVGDYLTDAVSDGGVAVVIATPEHRRAFEARLNDAGIDMASARDHGAYLDLDAGELVALMTADGGIGAAFEHVVGRVIRAAGRGDRPVSAYGEMVALLWDSGLVSAAIELEARWNQLSRECPFSLFCGYPAQLIDGCEQVDAFNEMCVQHGAVVGDGCAAESKAFALSLDASDPPGSGPPSSDAPSSGPPGSGPPSSDAPALARHFAVRAVERLGAGHLADDTALIVTELAANAVLHARSAFTVALSSRDGTVRISVRDECAPTEALAAAPLHGLGMVAALAKNWGVIPLNGGKTVWADLTA